MAEETGPPGAAVSEEEGGEVASGASVNRATADPVARIEALEAELATAHAERVALHEQLASAQEALTVGAAHYREAVLATAPDVPPELVAGASVAEVDRSLAAARETVAAVQRRLAERVAAERVPAGAPPRGSADLSALSPREKIALALSAG